MIDKILRWAIKNLIILYHKYDPSVLALSIGYTNDTSFSILVCHYYKDGYSIGTREIKYQREKQNESNNSD